MPLALMQEDFLVCFRVSEFGKKIKLLFNSCGLLPPASEGWGKVMFSVCSHLGGYPYPIMLCNITQNAMGQPGGYPARSSRGGTLVGGYPGSGGGTLAVGGYPGGGVPS